MIKNNFRKSRKSRKSKKSKKSKKSRKINLKKGGNINLELFDRVILKSDVEKNLNYCNYYIVVLIDIPNIILINEGYIRNVRCDKEYNELYKKNINDIQKINSYQDKEFFFNNIIRKNYLYNNTRLENKYFNKFDFFEFKDKGIVMFHKKQHMSNGTIFYYFYNEIGEKLTYHEDIISKVFLKYNNFNYETIVNKIKYYNERRQEKIEIEKKKLEDEREEVRIKEENNKKHLTLLNNEYYLCHQTRSKILFDENKNNILYPSGEIDQSCENCGKYNKDYTNNTKFNTVGYSSYGIYFRFIKKEKINNIYNSNSNSNINPSRTLIFDIEKLIKYIKNNNYNEEVLSVNKNDAYGQKTYDTKLLTDIDFFIEIYNKLKEQDFLNKHEVIFREPINLYNEETPFIGFSNVLIL